MISEHTADRLASASHRVASGRARARVLVVDDHRAVRKGLHDLLTDNRDLRPVGEAAGIADAIEAAERLRPQLAIVDYSLGKHDGLLLCRLLKALDHPPRVLVFSAYVDDYLTIASIVAGADGIVSKAVLGNEVCDVARRVVAGETVRPSLNEDAFEEVASWLDSEDIPIFAMLVRGSEAAEIAARLHVPEGQVEARRWAILKRLRKPGVGSTAGARRERFRASKRRDRRRIKRHETAAGHRARPATARIHPVRTVLRQFRARARDA